MNGAPAQVVLESSGQVRDLSGRRVGTHDPMEDARELRSFHRLVGELSRGLRDVAGASSDLRTLAQPQGALNQPDVSTQPTVATSYVGPLDGIADIVCPVTFVSKSSGAWLGEDVAKDLASASMPQRAGTGSTPVLNPAFTNVKFDASDGIALSVEAPSEVFDNADLDLAKLSLCRLVNVFALGRELRVANLLTTAANWPTGNKTAAAVKWNGVSPTPLVDVFAVLAQSIVAPTHMIFTEAAARYFFTDTNVVNYVRAGGPLPQILVGKMRKMTAAAADYVWGSTVNSGTANAMLIYAGQDPEAVSTARTFRYIGDAPDKEAAQEANGYLVRSFHHAKSGPRGSRSLVLVANESDQLLSGQLGGMITGVLA